jgi:hypothetical protein
MDVVDVVGRVLFAFVFWQNGYRQLANRAGSVAYAKSFGAPSPGARTCVNVIVRSRPVRGPGERPRRGRGWPDFRCHGQRFSGHPFARRAIVGARESLVRAR